MIIQLEQDRVAWGDGARVLRASELTGGTCTALEFWIELDCFEPVAVVVVVVVVSCGGGGGGGQL